MAHGLKEVEVKVEGPGSGRSAIRALKQSVLEVNSIKDVTPGSSQRMPSTKETSRLTFY